MPVKQDSINRDLYGMLKSRGYRPDMFTSAGKKVAIPDEAEAFQFDFVKDGENYGKVTVTVDGLHRLIIYYGDDVENSPKADSHDSESFTSLRQHLKRFAKNKQLGFELSDIDDLEADMAKRDHTQRDKLAEGYYPMGKMKSYSDNVPSTKIILQHSRQIEEGEQRYRNISKIFVENVHGERFLVPTTKPGLARVYARHIAEGGTPYDERGQHITNICEEYSKMAGFVRATKNKQYNESVQQLVTEGVNHYTKLRETLHKMAGKRGYREYFENYTPALMEDENVDLSEMFMQSSLDPRIESVMPILGKLSKNIGENKIAQLDELAEWADNIIEGNNEDDRYNQQHKDFQKKNPHMTPDAEITSVGSTVDSKGNKITGMATKTMPSKTSTVKRLPMMGVKEEDDSNFNKLPASMQASPQAVQQAKDIIQQRADQNVISMAKIGGSIPEPLKDDMNEVKDDDDEDDGLIGGRYTQDEWDAMVNRVKQLAHKQEAEKRKKQNEPEDKTNEGLNKQQKQAGQLGPTDKVSTGPILGHEPQSQKGLRGKLVGAESVDPLLRLKNLSGLQE